MRTSLTWTPNRTSEPKLGKILKEDTSPERLFRHILEKLKLKVTSQVEGDFTVEDFVFEVDGDWKDGDQNLIEKREWKRSELRKRTLLVYPIREWWIKHHPELVERLVLCLIALQVLYVKEKGKK